MSTQTPELLPFYSFDTSAFINGRRDLFRPNTFGAIWDAIEDMIKLGSIRAVDEVEVEVSRQDDEVAKWAKKQRNCQRSLKIDPLRVSEN